MERGASEAKVADKSETRIGSSSEVATAAPPGPRRTREEAGKSTLALVSIDHTYYLLPLHQIISERRDKVSSGWIQL